MGQPAAMPESFGPYEVLSLLGEGGMGQVWLCAEPGLARRVAVKVVKLGMDTRDMLARFERERHALALMDHAGIARVFEAGATAAGQPWFAMEYVPGVPLVQYCDDQHLDVRARLRLFVQICEAVQHAHQKGVIHRDLKPGNILVREEQDRPVAKIIDFGLARVIQRDLPSGRLYTEAGQFLGTPEYMSPEQAGVSPLDIDTRVDIYSLGVVLYELLVGELPLSAEELRRVGMDEMLRQIREVEAPAPSTRLAARMARSTSTARARGTTVDRLRRTVARDLDWVALKALAKDRRRRYPTAQGLADDIERFLRDEPVNAGPPGSLYRLRKWLARHRLQAAAAAAVTAALALAGFVQWRSAVELHAADRRELLVEQATDVAALLREAEVDLWPMAAAVVPHVDDWCTRVQAWLDRVPDMRELAASLPAPVAGGIPNTAQSQAQRLRDGLARVDTLRTVREGMDWRRERARSLAQRTVAAHQDAWARAVRDIVVSPIYGHLHLRPQPGLVPIGANEAGLYEFYVLDSAGQDAIPARAEAAVNGHVLTADTGIILVLVPGRRVAIGAGDVEGQANFDPRSRAYERPATTVDLAPYFLSRYELTQAQWCRLAALDRRDNEPPASRNPSQWREDPAHGVAVAEAPILPVEQVSYAQARVVLRRVGLELPTMAQWECALRAGATDVRAWDADSAARAMNALNPEGEGRVAPGVAHVDRYDRRTAPVGTFPPNAWGFHDLYGNVAELCLDLDVDDYRDGFLPGSGLLRGQEPLPIGVDFLRTGTPNNRAILRGGNYATAVADMRPSQRSQVFTANILMNVGVRPARSLE